MRDGQKPLTSVLSLLQHLQERGLLTPEDTQRSWQIVLEVYSAPWLTPEQAQQRQEWRCIQAASGLAPQQTAPQRG